MVLPDINCNVMCVRKDGGVDGPMINKTIDFILFVLRSQEEKKARGRKCDFIFRVLLNTYNILRFKL